MSVKEDALLQSAQIIFDNGQTHRVLFCNGTWSETTSTKQEIFSSELSVIRPEISYVSAIYDVATNSLTVVLQNNNYVSADTITFNRIAILSEGKIVGSFPILSIAGNVITLNGTPTDWQVGETVYTTSGEYVIQNISGNQVTLDATPTGTTLVNGTGSLVFAIELDSKTFSPGTTNQLEAFVVLSGN